MVETLNLINPVKQVWEAMKIGGLLVTRSGIVAIKGEDLKQNDISHSQVVIAQANILFVWGCDWLTSHETALQGFYQCETMSKVNKQTK